MAASMMIEAARTSKTAVNFYHTTRRSIPEDIHLHREDILGQIRICFELLQTWLRAL
jgi:hypothetical protein